MFQGKADGNYPVIQDGWKLVPIEPTEDMIVEGFEPEQDKRFIYAEVWEAYGTISGFKQTAYRRNYAGRR